ncbi:endodeoxyribonuclease [Agrobacterium pusense]|uniref:Endodeoxyribonuclease n=1 Tax=Agrobacterium pusense TaxID=648995 RepID=A0A6H0ZL03_9HYPH|nr:endodeoxyribonuclease [Agrobacterium pusense]QIX20611.1 endodeoxyribonuclease [Agrobacterium pusense]WCK25370.1 endodeoxyribonuclease [Agrobacterium pusense]
MTYRTRASQLRAVGIREGFRSGLEDKVADQLKEQGIDPRYEQEVIPYVKPERKAKYTPDFRLPNGIYIETKGRFQTEDRQKHLLIKGQHPSLDIRFVFSNPNARINKTSKTTYADWCLKYGFKYAAKTIPQEWIDE